MKLAQLGHLMIDFLLLLVSCLGRFVFPFSRRPFDRQTISDVAFSHAIDSNSNNEMNCSNHSISTVHQETWLILSLRLQFKTANRSLFVFIFPSLLFQQSTKYLFVNGERGRFPNFNEKLSWSNMAISVVYCDLCCPQISRNAIPLMKHP